MAYFLRLAMKDQSLAIHRTEYPAHIRTCPKLCEVIRQRFDSATRKETNSRELLPLTFLKFLKEANGYTLKAFNALVLRVKKISAIATPDHGV